jgi:hypothetical protein
VGWPHAIWSSHPGPEQSWPLANVMAGCTSVAAQMTAATIIKMAASTRARIERRFSRMTKLRISSRPRSGNETSRNPPLTKRLADHTDRGLPEEHRDSEPGHEVGPRGPTHGDGTPRPRARRRY